MPSDAPRGPVSPAWNDLDIRVPSPTDHQRRILDAAASIADAGAADAGELTFLARMVVQASLPYRDPGDCTFTRRNGDYTLTLQAPPHIGLPYGRYPRLVLAHLCREALRTKCREIHLGESMAAFMRTVGVRTSGGANGPLGRFRRQVVRLFATTISCSWTGRTGGADVREELGTRIASRSVVWWSSPGAERTGRVAEDGWLVLSPDFYTELVSHPVPLDRRVLRALTSSFALDLYAWTTHRMSRLRRPVSIRWPELARQFGSQEKRLRNFRIETRKALQRIRVVYPRLRFEVTREALRLYPSGPHVARGVTR
ncbi:MAG: replication protein RepA [Acidobacteriota bacterium]|jgi:hypothetical protein